eukprot:TRINITY_DN12020_c0_g1_i1.p1 TRINITY_DN12020_c0_g1~~TRINITY_DN12020_c0_g1_i1.p1  ORF type:complete len:303 (-),score=56.47 TRINITY_DN12020_c0_g1_i1:11-811(-)
MNAAALLTAVTTEVGDGRTKAGVRRRLRELGFIARRKKGELPADEDDISSSEDDQPKVPDRRVEDDPIVDSFRPEAVDSAPWTLEPDPREAAPQLEGPEVSLEEAEASAIRPSRKRARIEDDDAGTEPEDSTALSPALLSPAAPAPMVDDDDDDVPPPASSSRPSRVILDDNSRDGPEPAEAPAAPRLSGGARRRIDEDDADSTQLVEQPRPSLEDTQEDTQATQRYVMPGAERMPPEQPERPTDTEEQETPAKKRRRISAVEDDE